MAFNIKVYAGTASDTNNMYQKIIQGMTTVFGYAKTSGSVTGQGWEVISADGGNSKYFLKSKGSDGLDDMVYSINNQLVINGIQNVSGNSVSTYGVSGALFGKVKMFIPSGVGGYQFWMYGNDDFIHIFTRGYGENGSRAENTAIFTVSFGKFIPTYNPSITHVASINKISIGSDVIIPVNDASIFEPNRYITISSALTWEKTLVTEVSYAGNTIKVSNISQDHQVIDGAPIILGEMAKPYYIWGTGQTNTNTGMYTDNQIMVLPRVSGTMLSLSSQDATRYGHGVRCDVFTQIGTLAQYSALDMLNYDRYMFELYIYCTEPGEYAFLGKIPYIYMVGSEDTNSESTIINDQYFLYRVFQDYNLRAGGKVSLAVRESYK